MRLQLLRDHTLPDGTSGRLSVEGVFECYSLEPKLGDYGENCAMPPGTYPVQIRYSPKFQKMLAHIDGVPGRSAIEIHDGNFVTDTEGCVLVGQERLEQTILHSDLARQALQSKIAIAQAKQQPVTISVENPTVTA